MARRLSSGQWVSNFVGTTLLAELPIGGTALTLTSNIFASWVDGDWAWLVLTQAGYETSWEIVKATKAAGVVTITRAQQGTTAALWPAGSKVEIRVTEEDIATQGPQGVQGIQGIQGVPGPAGTVTSNSGMAVGTDPGGSEVLRVGGDAKLKGSIFFESSSERQLRAYGASVSWGLYLASTGCGLYDWQNARNILGYAPGTNVRTCDGVLQIVGTTQTLKLSPNDVEFANNGWSNLTQRTVGGSIALKCSAAAPGDTTAMVVSASVVTMSVPHRPAQYTVATLPAGSNGLVAYATNGRKPGEGAGAGTGCHVVYSNGAWRRLSDETQVLA